MERVQRYKGGAWVELAPPSWWKGSPVEAIATMLDEPETQALLEEAEATRAYPRAVIERARRAGFASVVAGEHATAPHLCTLNAVTARRSGSLAITLGVTAFALLPVYIAADEALLGRVLSRVRDGASCALLLSELAHGSNLLRIESAAWRDGDAWLLSGEKNLINGATYHDLLVTLVRTRTREDHASPLASRGDLSLIVVDRDGSVEALPRWRTLPVHAADIAGVRFAQTRAPPGAIVGDEGDGFGIVQRTLTISRGGIGAFASGAASDALDRSLHHARTRDVYGGPILQFGAIAEHVMRIATMDALAAACAIKSAALSNVLGTGAAHAAAVAKYACSALAEEAVDEGRHVLGARALLEEAGFARLVRDVVVYGAFDGTRHVMLDQLQWRLAQFASVEPPSSSSEPRILAFARETWGRQPRPLIASLRERARVYLEPIDLRLRALASVDSTLDLSSLIAAADALMRFVREQRSAGTWDGDQATRFAAAAHLTDLEALAALFELAHPPWRDAMGLPPLGDPHHFEAVCAYALAWFGARTLSRIELLTDADLSAERRSLTSGIPRARAQLLRSIRPDPVDPSNQGTSSWKARSENAVVS